MSPLNNTDSICEWRIDSNTGWFILFVADYFGSLTHSTERKKNEIYIFVKSTVFVQLNDKEQTFS